MEKASYARWAGWGLLLLACAEEERIGPGGLDLAAIDESISPCEDFYRFACGGWQKDHPVREDSSTTRRASDAYYAMTPDLKAIIRGTGDFAADGVDWNIGDYFVSCKNAERDPLGRSAVVTELRAVYATTNVAELLQLVAKFRLISSLS
ncbi:MAG TPA: hypothetical protein VKP30_13100, partial [Polyangiaceae bacterium]|nr:hypothetical protein [Polyangiaceae bacterium]